MIFIDDIVKAHKTIDNLLKGREARAKKSDTKLFWENSRKQNDQAYFILVFGRFEEHITHECAHLLGKKKSVANWLDRRLWDTIDIDKLEFMRKIALLTEKGRQDYNRIYDLYKQFRNNIAHGNTTAIKNIDLRILSTELRALSTKLRAV